MNRFCSLGAALVVLLALNAYATDLEKWDEGWLKSSDEKYGFNQWPGKAASLKKGLLFSADVYPSLTKVNITSDDVSVQTNTRGTRGVLRRLRIKVGEKQHELSIRIGVAISGEKAHEMIVFDGLCAASGGYSRRDDKALPIGDVRLVYESKDGRILSILFARNNLFISISTNDSIDVQTLAKEFDEKIKNMPDLPQAEFDATRPKFEAFEPAVKKVKPRETVEMKVIATDPTGTGISFPNMGKVKDDKINFFAPEKPGPHTFAAYAVNGFLQFTRAEATIEVTKE